MLLFLVFEELFFLVSALRKYFVCPGSDMNRYVYISLWGRYTNYKHGCHPRNEYWVPSVANTWDAVHPLHLHSMLSVYRHHICILNVLFMSKSRFFSDCTVY